MELILFILRVISALALLSFVGTLGWMIYHDMRLTSQLLENPEDDRAALVLISSQSKLYVLGTRFGLRPVTGIGRGAGNTIVIADDFASGEHALVARRGSQWWLEDLNSSNGTLLNGTEVGRPVVVTAGDVIMIGSTELRLEM